MCGAGASGAGHAQEEVEKRRVHPALIGRLRVVTSLQSIGVNYLNGTFMKHGETREKLSILAAADKSLSIAGASDALGITRQQVSKHLKVLGIKLKDARMNTTRPHSGKRWTNHFGGTKPLPSHFIGGASELCVCADLLKKGVPVYRAVTFVSSADLVADLDGVLTRIEVRSVRRQQDGKFHYSAPHPERFDVLALVDMAGVVEYRPAIF